MGCPSCHQEELQGVKDYVLIIFYGVRRRILTRYDGAEVTRDAEDASHGVGGSAENTTI